MNLVRHWSVRIGVPAVLVEIMIASVGLFGQLTKKLVGLGVVAVERNCVYGHASV
jgi:hypothetical protein